MEIIVANFFPCISVDLKEYPFEHRLGELAWNKYKRLSSELLQTEILQQVWEMNLWKSPTLGSKTITGSKLLMDTLLMYKNCKSEENPNDVCEHN